MGQLIRENNPYTNLTTAAELGTVKKTNTYTYGDSNWKDKLTAYNSKTITYDKIGNPLTYRDSLSFTWKNGRQLASLQNGNSVVDYTYNADGVTGVCSLLTPHPLFIEFCFSEIKIT